MVLDMVKDAGFDPEVAERVIMCESGWKTTASHHNLNGTWDIGLWQINDIHGLPLETRQDPVKSTQFAIKLLNSNRSWNHWVCY